jgi:lipid II:glycine glycyltransferase (peptidoglycan interpeptide bridge formation enzyme)
VTKGFQSASSSLLLALAKWFIPQQKMLIGTARLDGEPVGIMLFFLHGTTATYQTGWASDIGKKHAAHNILLWQACQVLRQAGIKDLDLGGVNDAGAAGVKKFKEGMGGELVRYVGQYC